MGDLHLGDVHVVPVAAAAAPTAVALVVAQTRDRQGRLSAVQLPALETALAKLSAHARTTGASVHLPRIGQRSPGFDWYRTERCIRKGLCARGVPTYVYYYVRHRGAALAPSPTPATPAASATSTDPATDEDAASQATEPDLPPSASAAEATLPDAAPVAAADDVFADLSDVGEDGEASGDERRRGGVIGVKRAASPATTDLPAQPPPAVRAVTPPSAPDAEPPALHNVFTGCRLWFAMLDSQLVRVAIFYDGDGTLGAWLARCAGADRRVGLAFFSLPVVEEYDADVVTHVVVPDDPVAATAALDDQRAAGSLPSRLPATVPLVRAGWIRDSAASGALQPTAPYRVA
jgi:hypothetical protein